MLYICLQGMCTLCNFVCKVKMVYGLTVAVEDQIRGTVRKGRARRHQIMCVVNVIMRRHRRRRAGHDSTGGPRTGARQARGHGAKPQHWYYKKRHADKNPMCWLVHVRAFSFLRLFSGCALRPQHKTQHGS